MSGDGVFEEEASAVVLVDDASGQGQAEAPAAALGGEAAVEDALLHRGTHALAGVADVDVDVAGVLRAHDGHGAGAFHGVDGVLAEVLYHPLEEVPVQRGYEGLVLGEGDDELHLPGRAALQVAYGSAHGLLDTLFLQLGHGADFREAVGDSLQALEVFADLGGIFVAELLAFQVVGPRHERGEGSAQLMGRLLGQTHPDAVLLHGACGAEDVVADQQQHDGDDEVEQRH